jgi:hypothetical protein
MFFKDEISKSLPGNKSLAILLELRLNILITRYLDNQIYPLV